MQKEQTTFSPEIATAVLQNRGNPDTMHMMN
jgi:hypothetical protein